MACYVLHFEPAKARRNAVLTETEMTGGVFMKMVEHLLRQKSAGMYFSMSILSWGLAQGWQHATDTRRWESVSGVPAGRPKSKSADREGIKRVAGRVGAVCDFFRRDLFRLSERSALTVFASVPASRLDRSLRPCYIRAPNCRR